MSKGQLASILAKTILNRGELAEIRVESPSRTGIVSRISVWAEPTLTVLLLGFVAESQRLVVLTAILESGAATGWEWEQTGGLAVSLSGTANERSFTSPATTNGSVLTFRVRALGTDPTKNSAWATATVTVRAHGAWVRTASGWAPSWTNQI